MLEKLSELRMLINEAEIIFCSDATDNIKYTAIFNMRIIEKAAEYGFEIAWCDTDSSYEEDTRNLMSALRGFRDSLGTLGAEVEE